MANYISTNAIVDIPITAKDANVKVDTILKSSLFRSEEYLVALAKNPVAVKSLKKDNTVRKCLGVINIAFTIIKELYSNSPNFILSPSGSTSPGYTFDNTMESNVIKFQQWVGLPQTGIIDSKTLLSIDSKLTQQSLTDAAKTTYIGKNTRKRISFQENYNPSTLEYSYSAFTYNANETFKINTKNIFSGYTILAKEDKSARIKPSAKTERQLYNEMLQREAGIFIEKKLDNPATILVVKKNQPVAQINISNRQGFEDELAKTPPMNFDDPDAKIYKVEADDSFGDIVTENYYNTGALDIKDPYTGATIVTLPNRVPFAVNERSEDARFQFYLNLLYYYNSEYVLSSNSTKEYGMKKSGTYQRYNVNHLDDVNVFDNTYNSSNPKTALPNYYRFLKRMEALNAASKIQFDSTGKVLSFVPDPGKNIIIPSRKFADSLYNYLNYRHDEMLTKVDDNNMGQVQGSVLDGIINTLGNAIDAISGVIDSVKNEAVETYHEVADFFVKAYNFAIQSLAQYWPRGTGGLVGGEFDILFTVFNFKGSVERHLWREVTKPEDFNICFSEAGSVGVGLEVMSGGGVGLYSGVGRQKKSLGLNAGAGASIVASFKANTEYQFPIRKEETALLSMVIAVFGGEMVTNTSRLLDYLNVINLDPHHYLTKLELGVENKASAWSAAQAGFNNGTSANNLHINQSNIEDAATQEGRKSFGLAHNLLSQVPGVGAQATGDITCGLSLSFEAEYDMNPKVSNIDARVFSKAKIDLKYYAQAQLGAGPLGSFLQKLVINYVSSSFFNALDFDKGIMIGCEWEFERKSDAKDVTISDIRLGRGSVQNKHFQALTNGKLKISNNAAGDRFDKSVSLYFGYFTGDVGTIGEAGTEMKLNLDMGEIKKMGDDPNYNFTYDNVKKILKNFEYRKKVGVFAKKSDATRKKENKVNRLASLKYPTRVADSFSRSSSAATEAGLLKKFFSGIKSGFTFVDGSLALDFKVNMEFSLVDLLFEFYINKLYYKYSILTTTTARASFEKNLALERKRINDKISKQLNDGKAGKVEKGIDYYNFLFSENEQFTGTVNKFKGLNFYIKDLIGGNTANSFFEVVKYFIKGVKAYNSYLNNVKPTIQQNEDFGIEDFIDFFSFIASVSGLEAGLEAVLGTTVGGQIGGGEGPGVRGAVHGFTRLSYQGTLFENGELTDLPINDPLRTSFDEINRILVLVSDKNRIGIKTLLKILTN